MAVDTQHIYNALAKLNSLANATQDTGYALDEVHGQWQLFSHHQHKYLSSLLSKSAFYDWIWAFIEGYNAAQKDLHLSTTEKGVDSWK
jgi:hypothetical protein